MAIELLNNVTTAAPVQTGLEGVVDEQFMERLAGLSHITMADQVIFAAALQQCKQNCSFYFFPFLYSFARTPNRPLLWEKAGDSICVYMLRTRKNVTRLRLYLPPFPFDREALKLAEERQRKFNGDRQCTISWVDQSAGPCLMQHGYRLAYQEDEYIYDGDLASAAEGPNFSRLRRNLSRVRKLPGLAIREYTRDDRPLCLELLARWRKRRSEQGVDIDGYGYTRRIVENAAEFNHGMVRGEVVFLDEKLVSFTFGGQLTPDMECIFVGISDHDVASLGYLLRHSFMVNGPKMKLFNDGVDGGNPGIRDVKMVFCPVEMNHLYRAFLGE